MLIKSVCILFSGKAGTGKTTSAEYCWGKTASTLIIAKLSIAQGVKEAARNSFNWGGRKDEAGRKLLQMIGRTGREYNKNLWISKLLDEIIPEQFPIPLDMVFIDDWRYENELEYIKKDGLYQPVTVRINAPDREILKGTDAYLDSSETELDNFKFDYYVDNSGTFEQLHTQLDFILEKTIKEYTFGDH